ncbi:MAG: hypothetical protein CSB34_03840 [Desulfobulbus propionicus]|nr:MAG: hypothetical protein CSB34_03840 [Desulfobulbus propionicus]
MAVDQKVFDKLQKLLALSASDNGNEAELALEKAQALMNEHNLTVLDVAQDGSGASIKDERIWGFSKNRQKWEESLGNEIAKAFDGRAIISPTLDGWYITFIASKTDVAIITDLFERLRLKIRKMSKAYVEEKENDKPWLSPQILHESYRIGVVMTIRNRLKILREHTRPDAKTKNQYGLTGMDLMVIKNQSVEERVNAMFCDGLQRESVPTTKVYTSAYRQGKEDGDSISLNPSVKGKKPAMLTCKKGKPE